jgi:hypothetical protein
MKTNANSNCGNRNSGLLAILVACLGTLPFAQAALAPVVIDSFDNTCQYLTVPRNLPPEIDVFSEAGPTAAGEALGNFRDVQIVRTATYGTIEGEVHGLALPGAFTHSSGPRVTGKSILTWDGADNSRAIQYTGLGGVDLTGGGVYRGLLVSSVADHPATIEFRIYQSETRYSTSGFLVPYDPNLTAFGTVFLPFSTFNQVGGGADLTRVGAVQMIIEGSNQPNLQVAVDYAMTAVPELSTGFMGAGALAILLMFASSVHSRGSCVIRINGLAPLTRS